MHILVIRLSAMGDVVLTLPVIRGFLNANPHARITLVTRSFFVPFFSTIDRLEVFCPDFKQKHHGFTGLLRLFSDLKKHADFDAVIDLHKVIRTAFLTLCFRSAGKKCYSIRKERLRKKMHLKSSHEPNLKHITERYQDVFEKAGFSFQLMDPPVFSLKSNTIPLLHEFLEALQKKNKQLIGIAPFARHKLKILPEEKLHRLLEQITSIPAFEVLLFGGGTDELEKLNELATTFKNCHVVELNLEKELIVMKELNLMITMDSANMHIAALSNIPVISVWGATHPGMGFNAWKQPLENCIQIPVNELSCRPCTVFGKGKCHRGDFACMQWIQPQQILDRVQDILNET